MSQSVELEDIRLDSETEPEVLIMLHDKPVHTTVGYINVVVCLGP